MRCRSTLPRALALAAALALSTAADAAGPLRFAGAVRNGNGGVTGLGAPNDVATSPDGAFVYVVATQDASIAWFARDAQTGALAFAGRVIGDGANPPGPVPDLARPVAIALSPDGAHVYVAGGTAGAGTSAVVWFDRDAQSGALTFAGSLPDGSGPNLGSLDTPLDVLASADGANVYVSAFEARAVTVFARDAGTGDLTPLQVVQDDANGVDGLEGIQRLAESPDGANLYVASASRPVTVPGVGGVAAFARAADGTLAFLEVEQDGVAGVHTLFATRDVVVSPDGAHVYAAAGGRLGDSPPQGAGVARFARAADGRLTFLGAIPESAFGGGEPRAIETSPDGAHVYAVCYGRYSGTGGTTPGKLIVFARDAQSGALAIVDRSDSGSDGVVGLAGAVSIDASQAGFAIVASELDPFTPPPGALALFAPAPPGAECDNGIDDDADGFPDAADGQCETSADDSESPDCRNGIDDDGDGLADHPADPQCTGANDPAETVDCTNGRDDDADGLADAADPGCSNPQLPDRENPKCDDGADNDGDGGVDWDGGPLGAPIDAQCAGKPSRNKEDASCGFGAELIGLAPLLARLRRRTAVPS